MYRIAEIISPYSHNSEQDMWIGEISFINESHDKTLPITHNGCIEVRADYEKLLEQRLTTIVNALNEDLS